MRKVAGIEAAVPKPVLEGPPDADVTDRLGFNRRNYLAKRALSWRSRESDQSATDLLAGATAR